ncbi:hypothetical protein ER13_16170 [Brevundimonas sp. EAKA]|nr:hypothetical protein ER13_16170 [Brevundimonas sp. EAKA]
MLKRFWMLWGMQEMPSNLAYLKRLRQRRRYQIPRAFWRTLYDWRRHAAADRHLVKYFQQLPKFNPLIV